MSPHVWVYFILFLVGYALGAAAHRPGEVIVTPADRGGEFGSFLMVLLALGVTLLFLIRLLQ